MLRGRSNFDNNASERKKVQFYAEEISSPEHMVLGRLKGFAEDAGGKIDLRSLLKQQTLRAESGIEQQEGNEP